MTMSRCAPALFLACVFFVASLPSIVLAQDDGPAPRRPYHTALNQHLLDDFKPGTVMERGAAPAVGARPVESIGLRLAPGGQGVWRRDDVVLAAPRLATENDQGHLYAEFEDADYIDDAAAAGHPRVKDDLSAFGGKYVEDPRMICVPFRVVTPGRKDIYIRVRERTDDENRFLWTIDGGRRWHVSKEQKPDKKAKIEGKSNKWTWRVLQKNRPTEAGDHRFLEHSYYKGRWDFDRIAVLPAGTAPPQDAGPAATYMVPEKLVVETLPAALPPVDGLVKVQLRGTQRNARAEVNYEVSVDGSKTWQPAPDGDLSKVEVKPEGSRTLTFRITAQAAPGAQVADGITLTVRPSAAWQVIRNDFVRVVVDGSTGRLFRLTDLRNDRELIWPTSPASMFSVDLKKPGEAVWLRYSDTGTQLLKLTKDARNRSREHEIAEGLGAVEGEAVAGAKAQPARFSGVSTGKDFLRIDFVAEQSVKLGLEIRLDDTSQMIWTAQVANDHPELDVIRVAFPKLSAIRLGASGFDDEMIRPQSFGHYRKHPGISPVRDAKYPGSVVLPWQVVWDDRGGLGVTVRDPLGHNVGFEASEDGFFQGSFSTRVRKYHNTPARGGQVAWQYAVSVHPGAWHWTADRYREWARPKFTRPDYPDWFARNDGFLNRGLQLGGARGFGAMTQYIEDADLIGLKHIQCWGQFTGPGGGCCGPYWQPSPLHGTLDQFKDGIAAATARGKHIGFFHLHDRIDLYHPKGSHIYGFVDKTLYPPGTEFPTDEFHRAVQWVGDPAGKEFAYPLTDEQWKVYREKIEQYKQTGDKKKAPRMWHPVDLSDKRWWEYMRHWAIDKYVETWGASGHYFDVLGTGSTRESYDPRKGHHGHGLWGIGKMGIARTTLESARRRGHHDYFLLMEGMCDLPGQWAAPMISGLYHNHSETMRYTWPDMIIFEGHSNSGHHRPIRSLEASFVNGNRFDIVHSTQIMHDIVALRARTRDWIYRGRFMDTLGLTSPVEARLFLRDDPGAKGAAITVVNPEGIDGAITVDLKRTGPVRDGLVLDQTGRMAPVRLRRRGNTAEFDLPKANFAVVILPETTAPEHSLLAAGRLERDGQGSRIVLTVGNLSDQPIGVAVAPESTAHFRLNDPKTVVALPVGTVEAAFPVVEDSAFWRPERVRFRLAASGRDAGTSEFTVFPLMKDPSFEHTGNSEEAFAGEKSYRLGPSDKTNLTHFALYLEPGRRYRISVAYKQTRGKSQMTTANLWQVRSGRSDVNRKYFRFTTYDKWDRAEFVFDSADRFVGTSMYIYNTKSTRELWVDDVKIEDLGPVQEEKR